MPTRSCGLHFQARERGFTLIELSIVLVIIGLIVGGILTGQDMINAARIRAQLTQIGKYNSAVNTFFGKYNGLPGDLQASQAAGFGLSARSGAAGSGNGDGIIEGSAALYTTICGETALFWADLSTANLINGQFVGTDGSTFGGTCTATSASISVDQIIPAAKLGGGNYIVVYNDAAYSSSRNVYQILGGVTGIDNTGRPTAQTGGMTPLEAFQIDTKLDDGYPLAGRILVKIAVVGAPAPPAEPGPAPPGPGVCVVTTTPPTYDTGAYGNSTGCTISLRMD